MNRRMLLRLRGILLRRRLRLCGLIRLRLLRCVQLSQLWLCLRKRIL